MNTRTNDPAVVVDSLETFLNRLVGDIAASVAEEVAERTPVDTGWAQSRWTINEGDFSALPAPRPRDLAAAAAGASTNRARQRSEIANIRATYTLATPVITIANGAPYIQRLNDGHSAQAPQPFVHSAIASGIRRAARTAQRGRL